MQFVVQQLRPADRLSIISYSDSVDVDLPLTPMTSQGGSNSSNSSDSIDGRNSGNRKKAADALSALRCHGATNLSGGLLAAIEQLQNGSTPRPDSSSSRVAAIMLFTDGLANRGLMRTEQVRDFPAQPVTKSGLLLHSLRPRRSSAP